MSNFLFFFFNQVSLNKSEDGKEELVGDHFATGIGLGHVKVLTVQVAF